MKQLLAMVSAAAMVLALSVGAAQAGGGQDNASTTGQENGSANNGQGHDNSPSADNGQGHQDGNTGNENGVGHADDEGNPR